MKPYYEHKGISIFHGNCREILPWLEFEVMLTDPPYGISHPTNYAERGRDNLAPCTDYAPVFEDDRPFDPLHLMTPAQTILWGANYYADKLAPVSGWLVWNKERPHDLDQATAELAWTNCVKGVRVFSHLWNGMMRASENNAPLLHPTQKPVALMQWVLSLRWIVDGTICDPLHGVRYDAGCGKELRPSRHRHRDRGEVLRDCSQTSESGSIRVQSCHCAT